MHEWHTSNSKNPYSLVKYYEDFKFDTDYNGREQVSSVRITNNVFSKEEDAKSFIARNSYGGTAAYMAAYSTKKLTRGYQNAFESFLQKYREYLLFRKNLTISYGRKSIRVTCPHCDSSITLKYGGKFKACPVCGSTKIISDSNWKTLETKRKLVEKASETLAKEAEKNDVTFVCGIEWHS